MTQHPLSFHINPSHPGSLKGTVSIPASKSQTLRALLFASLAHGKSIIRNPLVSPDADAMVAACRALGARVDPCPEGFTVVGNGGKMRAPSDVLDAGNSGIVLRFVAAVAALAEGYTILTGDESLRSIRPVKPLLDGLSHLGAFAVSAQGNGHAPIIVKGPLRPGSTWLSGEDSQPVSALIIALAFASGVSQIFVENPGEKPWVEMTLQWLKFLNIPYTHHHYSQYTLFGQASYPGFEYTVPGDLSTCAFPFVAAVITKSSLILKNIDLEDGQGDKAFLFLAQKMGARFAWDYGTKVLKIDPCEKLVGCAVDVNDFVDAVPILAVLGCFAQGETRITGAAIARHKECDRLQAICQELKKMGADMCETPDGLVVKPVPLHAARVDSHGDHRMAMALAVAGLQASGPTCVTNVACVAKTYPEFAKDMQGLGADIVQQ